MIGSKFNMDDTFFRDLTVCVLDTLEGQVRWVNRFSSGDYPVDVPFYYSLTGDERFLLDSFQDDIVSENRFIELNTDMIPRGHITLKNFNILSDEFANPNVWLRTVVENEKEIRKVLTKVRAVPISVNYDLEILLESEIDVFKCSQSIMDTLWIYKFMYFEHNFMHIDAVMLLPDGNQIEISREKDLTSDNRIKLTVSFEVQTYYPAFRRDKLKMPGYQSTKGDGMTDLNGYGVNGGFSDYFDQSNDFVGGYGSTGSGGFTDGSSWPTGSRPEYGSDDFINSPKRTKWFNNILRAREKSSEGSSGFSNSGSKIVIEIDDAIVENSSGSFREVVFSGDTLILSDENITLNGASFVIKPSVEDLDIEMVDILNNEFDGFVSSLNKITIFPATVSNSDDSYSNSFYGVLDLPDVDITVNGDTFLTKPSVLDQDIEMVDFNGLTFSGFTTMDNRIILDDFPDTTVDNSDGSYTASIPSGDDLELPDEDITINGYTLLTKPSVKNLDIPIKYEDGSDVTPTSLVGGIIEIADLEKNLNVIIPYSIDDDSAIFSMPTGSDGTYTITTTLTITEVTINALVSVSPFTLVAGDAVVITFDTAPSDGELNLGGSYV